ncbi:uncharacterized protein SPAPADRAFT_57714 [Spathaspora passalidarum NRRL Y-27907]|uniref:Uncharacterized protein n=1 Tax=Spathaspora passalidarum (strain NRRL Y-27907 / 11-Y1) TaxID=619300 RepID=G3AGZ0_SPAPN|nr:uncharacterized protein SPAPADRAFT_57714 [Spathaspora passalidarum NRRL Y-27907]EGW34663.1 hypothetical protein SPAPADRAFT_57714 [Spathaspora passalidarum NRRL Y-27907]
MSGVIISNLPPPLSGSTGTTATAYTIKLNNEIISHLKNCLHKGITAKLVVKGGNYSIKISESLEFPCMKSPENLNVDIYSIASASANKHVYNGRIAAKLNVITDTRKIKQYTANANLAVSSPKPLSRSSPSPSIIVSTSTRPHANIDYTAFRTSTGDPDIVKKFIYLLALGPICSSRIAEIMHYENLKSLLDEYAQVYDPRDSFIEDDVFPSQDLSDDKVKQDPQYILKDKTYKELRPWKWNYSAYERDLIIGNINHALTRLGYSQTHPLRRKLCDQDGDKDEKPTTPLNAERSSGLGGGMLISKNAFKRAATDSPLISHSTPPPPPPPPAPVIKTDSQKRKLSSSSTSSDEEPQKKLKLEFSSASSSSSSSSSEEDRPNPVPPPAKKLDYYTNLAIKFKFKYKEYESLYLRLKQESKKDQESKKELVKLFEMHQLLSQWKKLLWDYDRDQKQKVNVMNLNKHKVSRSTSRTERADNVKRSVSPPKRRKVLDY